MGMLQNKLSAMTQTREVGKLLKDITEILDTLQGINCYIERSGNRWKINASPAGGGFDVRGTEGLFKIIALRAYLTSDDSIVAPETAFNAGTMYLHPTWDYERWP